MRLLLLFFLLSTFLFSSNSSNNRKDLRVLEQLDINKSFIKDKKLNHIFKKYSGNSHIHHYIKNIKSSKSFILSIKEILKKNNLPNAVLFIPMTESNFKVNVRSSSKAAGPWQFLPSTAKTYNLRNDKYIDERLDFIKSTDAASSYLKKYYKKFGKWYLSILAYNCGEGRIIEAITRATLDKYISRNKKVSSKILKYKTIVDKYIKEKKDFYKVNRVYKKILKLKIKLKASDLFKIDKTNERQYLPKESRTYLRKILAFAFISNRNFYLKKDLLSGNSNISTLRLKGGTTLKEVSKKAKIRLKKLKGINLHLKKEIIPKYIKKYSINIPKSNLFIYEGIMPLNEVDIIYYKVKKGDSLSKIANKFKVKIKAIKYYNNKRNTNIRINEKLKIPLEKKFRKYIVKKGDSLLKIAHKFAISYKELKRVNKLDSNIIKVNQKILIPIKNRGKI